MPHPPEPRAGRASADIPLADKLAFLARPEAYGAPDGAVTAIETHMSWVFLTATHAYKLKKPVRYPFLDYSTLARRRHMCAEEVRLNRRLAPQVYLGVLALVRHGDGRLQLRPAAADGEGTVVEWMVHMVRLPADRLLDAAIRAGTAGRSAAERTAAYLAAFYRDAPPERLQPDRYLARLAASIDNDRRQLVAWQARETHVQPVADALIAATGQHADLFAGRVADGRIVEGHGDLRPEHVFLGEPPAIIDCLEFSRELRLNDPLDELAFLRMECAVLGAEHWGALFLDAYARATGDPVPEEIVAFHMAARALLRARLALGHLHDGAPAEPAKWLDKTDRYLDLANRCAARLAR